MDLENLKNFLHSFLFDGFKSFFPSLALQILTDLRFKNSYFLKENLSGPKNAGVFVTFLSV